MFNRSSERSPGRRSARLAAAAAAVMVPMVAIPLIGGSISAASATPAGPTCALDTSNIGIQTDTQNAQISLIATAAAGLKHQISPYHINALDHVAPGAIVNNPGGAGSEETTFYQDNPLYTASGSLTVTDENGVATTCLGQFKSVTNGGRVESTGFGFPSDHQQPRDPKQHDDTSVADQHPDQPELLV